MAGMDVDDTDDSASYTEVLDTVALRMPSRLVFDPCVRVAADGTWQFTTRRPPRGHGGLVGGPHAWGLLPPVYILTGILPDVDPLRLRVALEEGAPCQHQVLGLAQGPAGYAVFGAPPREWPWGRNGIRCVCGACVHEAQWAAAPLCPAATPCVLAPWEPRPASAGVCLYCPNVVDSLHIPTAVKQVLATGAARGVRWDAARDPGEAVRWVLARLGILDVKRDPRTKLVMSALGKLWDHRT